MRWFPTPPLDVIDHDPVSHSKAYLAFKKSQKKSKQSPKKAATKTQPPMVDVEMKTEPVVAKPSQEALLKTLELFADALFKDATATR